MTTFAIAPADTVINDVEETDVLLPPSVANPRRTTWTGFAKNDGDRLPAN